MARQKQKRMLKKSSMPFFWIIDRERDCVRIEELRKQFFERFIVYGNTVVFPS